MKKRIAVLILTSLLLSLTGCSGDAMSDLGEVSTELLGEIENMGQTGNEEETKEDAGLPECQDLSKSTWVEIMKYDKDVEGFIYLNFAIPDICQWDENEGAFVAADNGTNENGESVKIDAKSVEIDKNADYSTDLSNLQQKLEENKDSYKSYELQHLDEDEVYSYYYVTETIETIDGVEMVRTQGYFELSFYKRPYSVCTYNSLIFEVEIVKPVEVTNNSVEDYIKDLYESMTVGYTSSIK